MKVEPRCARFQSCTLPHLDRLLMQASRWGDGQEAEDYVQETYIRAWAAFDQLRNTNAAFAWLCQILRTVAFERRRTRARRQDLVFITELEAAHEDIIANDAPSPLDHLLARLDAGRLHAALRSIPEDFAEASVPIGTVMSRISRGREMLAGLLMVRDEVERKEAVGGE